jgi:hypothetical protein
MTRASERSPKRAPRALVGAGLVALVLTAAAPTQATGPRVTLGEVSTRVVRPDVDLSAVLRAAVLGELATLESPRKERGPIILSAALVRMESDGGRVNCVVSATLRTARGGTMLAMLEGRAGVETGAPITPEVARRAVEAAARAAVVRVPEALR